MCSQPGTSQPGPSNEVRDSPSPLEVLREALSRPTYHVDDFGYVYSQEHGPDVREALAAVETLVGAAQEIQRHPRNSIPENAFVRLVDALAPFVSVSPTPPKDTQ